MILENKLFDFFKFQSLAKNPQFDIRIIRNQFLDDFTQPAVALFRIYPADADHGEFSGIGFFGAGKLGFPEDLRLVNRVVDGYGGICQPRMFHKGLLHAVGDANNFIKATIGVNQALFSPKKVQVFIILS